jgi:hypothetical protein
LLLTLHELPFPKFALDMQGLVGMGPLVNTNYAIRKPDDRRSEIEPSPAEANATKMDVPAAVDVAPPKKAVSPPLPFVIKKFIRQSAIWFDRFLQHFSTAGRPPERGTRKGVL